MIEARSLGRRFGDYTAVEGLDLNIGRGEVFGFLGPNGAGKTTTVRMLACLIRPTAGSATIGGLHTDDPGDARKIRRMVGILTERSGFYENLTAIRNLRFYADLYRIDRRTADASIELLLDTFGMSQWKDAKVGGFSRGMRQKLALVRCLLHDPDVLFLDEPTAGLDPESARAVRDAIVQLKKDGRTVFLCTHNLDEAERLCDRVAIVNRRDTLRGHAGKAQGRGLRPPDHRATGTDDQPGIRGGLQPRRRRRRTAGGRPHDPGSPRSRPELRRCGQCHRTGPAAASGSWASSAIRWKTST